MKRARYPHDFATLKFADVFGVIRSEYLLIRAVKKSPRLIAYFAHESEKAREVAIMHGFVYMIHYIPYELITRNLSLIYVQKHGNLNPDCLVQDQEIVEIAVRKGADVGKVRNKSLLTIDMCRDNIKMGGDIRNIPTEFITPDMTLSFLIEEHLRFCLIEGIEPISPELLTDLEATVSKFKQ